MQGMDNQKGATLLEILGVVAIIALLLVIVVTPLSPYRDTQALNADALAVQSLLSEARSQTLSSLDGSEYGVHFESDRAVLFQGFTFSEPSAYNKEVNLHPRLSISTIDINGGGSNIIFARLTGEATSTYGTTTISLISDTTKKREIVTSQSGIVSQSQ